MHNYMTPKIKSAYRLVRSKYVAAALMFAVWMGIADRRSVAEHIAMKRNIARMENEVRRCRAIAQQASQRLRELKSGGKNLEKYARERYLMHATDEDLYLITED